MAVRKILKWPNKLLKNTSVDVKKGEDVDSILKDMSDTMKANFGLGIAAPQINVFKKVVVILDKEIDGIEKDPNHDFIALINPSIDVIDNEQVNSAESCLSIDGYMDTVKRNKEIRLEYLNSNFENISVTLKNRDSCIIQHETDHLVGKLFIDRLSQIRKNRFISKYKKATKKIKDMFVDKEKISKDKAMKTRAENRKKRKKKKRQ